MCHSGPLARPVRTSGSTGSNETMCQNGRFEPAVHTFSRNWAFPIAIGRSRLLLGVLGYGLGVLGYLIGRSRLLLGVLGYALGVPGCYWAFSAMDWAFPIAYWAFPITY